MKSMPLLCGLSHVGNPVTTPSPTHCTPTAVRFSASSLQSGLGFIVCICCSLPDPRSCRRMVTETTGQKLANRGEGAERGLSIPCPQPHCIALLNIDIPAFCPLLEFSSLYHLQSKHI
ncbi:hypothetical protein J6590_041971 [Homalodisca vitripennis]|nr:hypothetical protein J6590_041971 [Homalodisca vitripennis]